MNISCDDRERIFLDGTQEEWTALEAHAAGCPVCRREVETWKNLSLAAADKRGMSNEDYVTLVRTVAANVDEIEMRKLEQAQTATRSIQ